MLCDRGYESVVRLQLVDFVHDWQAAFVACRCVQQLDEIRKVIAREKFDKLISSETRYYFFEMIYDVCLFTDITVEAESNIRDPKDLYLLSMAESVPVDFIVSGDKDLTDLGSHAGIPILKYSDFLTRIP